MSTWKSGKRVAGFTLIELLIVVAIIAILAAIAVPNFMEAQVRAKVGRVKADMRTLATAMETYFVDNSSYPGYWEREKFKHMPTAGYVLSTPIAYIAAAQIRDPFKEIYSNDPSRLDQIWLCIYTGRSTEQNHGKNDWPKNCYAILSFGPDREDNTTMGSYPWNGSEGNWAGEYDPTNGTKSRGEIWHAMPKAPVQWVIQGKGPGKNPFAY